MIPALKISELAQKGSLGDKGKIER